MINFKRANYLFFSIFLFSLIGCADTKSILLNTDSSKNSDTIVKYSSEVTIAECNEIIEAATMRNYYQFGHELRTTDRVLITAIPLTIETIKAMVKKRALERRWNEDLYFYNLDKELQMFTNLKIDPLSKKIVVKDDNDTNKVNTLSFKITFENNTNPFRPVEVDGGFECFFLENKKGLFGRVESIMDDFLFDYLLIDGYMSTIVSFNLVNDFGKMILNNNEKKQQFSLVFNGLQNKIIKLDWFLEL